MAFTASVKKVTITIAAVLSLAIVIPMAGLTLYYVTLFAIHGFNPHFQEFDECLDRGGAWNSDANACEFLKVELFQHPLPPGFADLKNAHPERHVSKVEELPEPVLAALWPEPESDELRKIYGPSGINLGDNNAKWNRTCLVDPSLPSSRLIWAVKANDQYIIHYEYGGVAYGTHFVIVAPSGEDKKWKATWSASAPERARDYEAFIASLEAEPTRK